MQNELIEDLGGSSFGGPRISFSCVQLVLKHEQMAHDLLKSVPGRQCGTCDVRDNFYVS